MYDFDEPISRRKTNSVKWDEICDRYHEEDLLPLWVADMDFQAPEGVLDAYQRLIDHGIFGYAVTPDSLYEAILTWEHQRHQLVLEKEEILLFSGVLTGITTAIQAFSEVNDAVLLFDPLYPPFTDVLTNNRRKIVRSRLLEENGHFVMDLADIEKKFQQEKVTLAILCNPHNPGGRVWTKAELQRFGELCRKYQVLVLSDEIHQDLVFPPNKMVPFFTAGEGFAEFSVSFTSLTKTFNLAGSKLALAFVKQPGLQRRLAQKQAENFQQEINTFGLVGLEAAYRTGETWLEELLVYLQGNIDYTAQFLQEHLPKVRMMKPEGTYLVWLDFSAYDLSDEALENVLVHKGKVVLNPGISYGTNGARHMRLNVACPRKTLAEGLQRIVTALVK